MPPSLSLSSRLKTYRPRPPCTRDRPRFPVCRDLTPLEPTPRVPLGPTELEIRHGPGPEHVRLFVSSFLRPVATTRTTSSRSGPISSRRVLAASLPSDRRFFPRLLLEIKTCSRSRLLCSLSGVASGIFDRADSLGNLRLVDRVSERLGRLLGLDTGRSSRIDRGCTGDRRSFE